MITGRIVRHEVLLPINHNFNKICDIWGSFFKSKQKKFQFLFAGSEKSNWSARVVTRGVQLPTSTLVSNCPIKAEIREVDSQSDLKILL